MNWKIFTIACVSTAMISFPENMIGCGPETDPYDYYSTFFHNNLPDPAGYKPFYYTGYNFLYDDHEPVSVANLLSTEWAGYCGVPVTDKDAFQFVNKYAWKDLNSVYLNLEKNQPLKIPDSVKRNSMTTYFMQNKDFEALGYLMYAKLVEPSVKGGEEDYWQAPVRDSIKMAKQIKNGQQLYGVAKKDFFKLKYAYQVLRLAHYSGRYQDVIKWYDDYKIESNTSSEILSQLCLGLKAGALFHTGDNKQAAYLFSKLFTASTTKRISNYLGFDWSYKNGEDRKNYLSLCKTNEEKANMLALFAIGSADNELPAMKEIYSLNPSGNVLEVLAVREVNKLEEKYLTPTLQKQPGGLSSFYYYDADNSDSIAQAGAKEVTELTSFYHKVAQGGKSSNAGLFEASAAYGAYMTKDFSTAKKYLEAANKLTLTSKVKDQLMLTSLLVTISSKNVIDKSFEEEILPSVQWLFIKAKETKPDKIGYWDENQWAIFYRNLMTDVLAKKYHAQNDLQKEVLCVGSADAVGNMYNSNSVQFLRSKFSSTDVEKMFALMDSKQLNAFESFLISNNKIKKATVIDFAGTAYLRDYNYDKAMEWFNKSVDKKSLTVNKNPFIDLLYDQEEKLASEGKFSTTKLAFAQEMKRVLQQSSTDKVNAAKLYYKYALGLYNMTYYGHAWELVEYYRGGSDGYAIPKDATAFQKEYFGAFTAMQYFEKAMNASSDKNFQARCLFMMAKCSQKQIRQPKYDDFTGTDMYDKKDAADKIYSAQFMNNKYFPQLKKDYSTTAFYKEALTSCSYLRDFIKKK